MAFLHVRVPVVGEATSRARHTYLVQTTKTSTSPPANIFHCFSAEVLQDLTWNYEQWSWSTRQLVGLTRRTLHLMQRGETERDDTEEALRSNGRMATIAAVWSNNNVRFIQGPDRADTFLFTLGLVEGWSRRYYSFPNDLVIVLLESCFRVFLGWVQSKSPVRTPKKHPATAPASSEFPRSPCSPRYIIS